MTLGDKPKISLLRDDRLYIKCQSCDKTIDVDSIYKAQKNKNGTYTYASYIFHKDDEGKYVSYRLCSKCRDLY